MLQGIRSMFGEKQGAFGALGSAAGSGGTTPGGGDVSGDLANQVRLDDIAGGRTSGGDENRSKEGGQGLLDNASHDADTEEESDGDFADDFDDGGSDGDSENV